LDVLCSIGQKIHHAGIGHALGLDRLLVKNAVLPEDEN
jgi:hypothetical protein